MIFFYTHRTVPYLVIIREASSGSMCEHIQRPTSRNYVVLKLGSPSNPSLNTQGILEKCRQKDCKSQRGLRTSGEQGPQNQLGKKYRHED